MGTANQPILGLESYRDISKMRGGTLRETPFGVLLFSLALHRRTVAIEVQRTHIKKTILLEDGIPFECHSNLLHETLAEFLVRRGTLGNFQAKECIAEAAEREVRLGEVLMEKALVDAVGLYKALQRNLAQKLLECFTWADGEFRTLHDLPEASSSMSINVPQLIFTGITKFAPREQVSAGVAPLLGERLALHPSPPVALSSLKVFAAQREAIDEIVRHLQAGEPLPAELTGDDGALRVLYALRVTGNLVPSSESPFEVPPGQPEGRSPLPKRGGEERSEDQDPLDSVFESLWVDDPVEIEIEVTPDSPSWEVSAPAAPADIRDQRRLCNEIMADYLSHGDKDPFALLGVAPDAPRALIRTKYVELCDKYAPRRFEAPQLRAVSEKADELLSAVILAFSELNDDERRKELLAKRGDRTPKRGQVLPESHFVSGAEELADSYCQRGHELMDTANFGAASDLFSLALASNPEQSAYAVELAYAHFRESERNADQSLTELDRVLNRAPGCVQALLYAAEVAHALGALDRAERYFLRGCELWASQWRGASAVACDPSPGVGEVERGEPGPAS